MTYGKTLFAAAAAIALFGCGSSDEADADAAATAEATPAATPAATLCLFEATDTKDWAGAPNAEQDVVVTGKVRVTDPAYTATLDRPEIDGEIARLWLSMAENTGGTAPADGWHDVTFKIDDDGSVRTVEIWCDMETMLAEFPARR